MSELIHTTAQTAELQNTIVLLSEKLAQPYYSEERKKGISQYLNYLFFELDCRKGLHLNAEQRAKIEVFNQEKGYLVE